MGKGARLFASAALLSLAACGGLHEALPSSSNAALTTVSGVSPALVSPAPMVKTQPLPSSAMHSARKSDIDIQGLNWTQLPGSASAAAAAPDGSLWVLSDQPSGADKYIWHYANGTWTNISGLAVHLAVAPDGTLYAINAGGGTYAFSGGAWRALGGGASAITVASDGSVYVISDAGSGDKAIWHNVNGSWSQMPGGGVALAASWDASPYTTGSGTIKPGGIYVLNSRGSIYYLNTDSTYVALSGVASAIAPTRGGGVFVLGYPADASGGTIYYDNLDSPGWRPQSGAGVSLSTDGSTLYVISASGAIYSSPIAPAQTLAVRALRVQFDERGWASGYWNGQTLDEWNTYDSVVGSTVSAEVSLQLDKMKAMGVNTIVYELRAADNTTDPSFAPPACYITSPLGPLYPQPTTTELTNLKALLDMVNGKGMKLILELVNTHMEESPPANNTTWLNAILQAVKGHPALYLVNFDGDVHVYTNPDGSQRCGIPAEAPLWLGYGAQPAQYVKWAIQYAHSLGIPYSQLSAESIVGSYIDENSSNLSSPIAVMKEIFDSLGVPDSERTYSLSWYEHTKCLYANAGTAPCTDEPPDVWADETLRYVYSIAGHNGAHVVATEMGDNVPVSSTWTSTQALDNLLTLMIRYGADGGAYWQWVNKQNSDDTDPTLGLPIKLRGTNFTYTPAEAVLQKYYGAP